jgi:hypothetical protein
MRRSWFAAAGLAVAGLSLSLLAVAAPVRASSTTSRASAAGVRQQVAGTYSGTVKQNGPALVTHDKQGDRTLVVQSGAPIVRNGKSVVISDLKKGDKITATLDANGTVTSIDASAGSSNAGAVVGIIVLVVLALVVVALAFWLLSRRRSHHGVLSHV